MNEKLNTLHHEAKKKADAIYQRLWMLNELGDETSDTIFSAVLAEMVALDCIATYLKTNPNTQKFIEYGTKFSTELSVAYRTNF